MTILIIDGNNMAHRARHKFNLSNRGKDVSVTYGFLRMLKSLLAKFEPQSIIVCWDDGIPEFRRILVPEYKAGRHDNDDLLLYEDFLRQMRELTAILPVMGIASVIRPGVEADDLMAHAARMALSQRPIIVTSDKDLLQCVNDYISVYSPMQDIIYTPDLVLETFGVKPHNITEWRALQGDSSDNIPGVVGIGEKTATKLFQQFGSLSYIINAALGIGDNTELLSERHKQAILDFGFERLYNNVKVSSLYTDRIGARHALWLAAKFWQPMDKMRVKKYLMRNAFTSLMDGDFYGYLMELDSPLFFTTGVKMPVVAFRRIAV